MYLEYYLKELKYNDVPDFLNKYLTIPSLVRLKKVGYFCGMDYASRDIYDFREYISRYDHSLTVALMTYMITKDKRATIAGLFHDIATPCFSHVIDYMNNDYEKQESTEEYTEEILRNDKLINRYLKEDDILVEDIINFKKYTIVDNDRPKLCADRLDGVILTGIGWTKNITKKEIKDIINDICIFKNEDNEDEIGFRNVDIAKMVLAISESIDIYCHSVEDNYMMTLLAKITKLAINKGYITYNDLYLYNEEDLFKLFKDTADRELKALILEFETIKKENISIIELANVKVRNLNPLVNGKRLKDII